MASNLTLPFNPAGYKALQRWYDDHNVADYYRRQNRGGRSGCGQLSKFGMDGQFRVWLFTEYGGAEVVRINYETFIRFTDEQIMTMFALRWS